MPDHQRAGVLIRRIARRVRHELRLSGRAAWRALVRLIWSNDFTHAAAIAYYSLLSLFPFVLLCLLVFGMVADDEEARTQVVSFVLRYFPARIDFLTQQIEGFRQNPIQVGAAGALGLVWGSLGVFGAVTHAVNEAWGVAKPRGFWKHRLASFLLFVTAAGALTAGLLIVSISRVAGSYGVGAALDGVWWIPTLRSLALQYLATILLIVALGLIYYFVPNERTRFRDVWVGAILTGVLWRAAFEGFSWFTARNARLQAINGPIAVVVVFLLWIYISAVILMYGVEFTAAHARARRPSSAPAPGPGL